jgi:hypothetical protein
MRLGSGGFLLLAAALSLTQAAVDAQTTGAPRTPDGKPDLSGIWQAFGTANDNILSHSASKDVPGGLGVVEGDEIPYRPEALAKRRENFANRSTRDSEANCYLPGVPRITYMPFPFQIVQMPDVTTILYEYVHAIRYIYTNATAHPPGPIEWWMGDSRGRWEGDTLVVDITDFNDQTWFDRAGNFHSDALHIVERYTAVSPYHLMYEVTVEDPKVFTRPWKMRMPLYRRAEKDKRILEYKCVEFVEEALYGHLGIVDPATGHPNK